MPSPSALFDLTAIGGTPIAVNKISHVTVIVRNQDETLKWYTEKLETHADDATAIYGHRGLTVAPGNQKELEIVPFQAHGTNEQAWVGQVTLWMLQTDDCLKTCEELAERGVKIVSAVREYPWGIGATIEDLYGNPFNVLQVRAA